MSSAKGTFSKGKDRLSVPSFFRGYVSEGVLLGEMLRYAIPKHHVFFQPYLFAYYINLNKVRFLSVNGRRNMSATSKTFKRNIQQKHLTSYFESTLQLKKSFINRTRLCWRILCVKVGKRWESSMLSNCQRQWLLCVEQNPIMATLRSPGLKVKLLAGYI